MRRAMDARRTANVLTRIGVLWDVVVTISNDDDRRHGELESVRGRPMALFQSYMES